MNRPQRDHLAKGLQTLALGQLAFFGFAAVSARHWLWCGLSAACYAGVEAVNVRLILRGGRNDELHES